VNRANESKNSFLRAVQKTKRRTTKTQQTNKTQKMKKTLLAALAIAGFAAVNSASAQSAYVDGDTLLVFRASGGTGASKNVQIDLGNFSSNNFSTINLDLSSASSILGLTYGSGWYSRNDLSWGFIGAKSSDFSVTLGIKSGFSAPSISLGDLGTVQAGLDNVRIAGAMGNAGQGTVEGYAYSIYDTSNGGSFTAADDGGFGTVFSGTITGGINQYSNLDLYQYGTDLDAFVSLSPVKTGSASIASGVITVQSVPEPSTFALIGFGALLLIVAYRRANA
jgi:hypothetical protein